MKLSFTIIFIFLASYSAFTQDIRLVLQSGHKQSPINTVAFKSDGKIIASGSSDGTIRIWDFETGMLLSVLTGHKSEVNSVSFSQTGDTLISSGKDKTVRLWDVIRGKLIRTYFGSSISATGAVIHPLSRIILGSDYSGLHIWDLLDSANFIWSRNLPKPVTVLKLSHSGQIFASGGEDHTLTVWNIISVDNIKPLYLTGHLKTITSLSFNQNSSLLASRSADDSVIIWNLTNNSIFRKFTGTSAGISLNRDGRLLAAGADELTNINVYNTNTSKTERVLKGNVHHVTCMDFSPDSRYVVSGSAGGELKVWDLSTGRAIMELDGTKSTICGLAVSPDGDKIYSANDNNTVFRWELKNESKPTTFQTSLNSIFSLAINRIGNLLAIGGAGWQSKTIVLLDTETQTQRTLGIFNNIVTNISFTPDSRKLIASTVDSLKIIELQSGKELFSYRSESGGNITSLAICPNGKELAFTEGRYIRLLNLADLMIKTLNFKFNQERNFIIYSTGGDTIIGSGFDGDIFLLNSKNGKIHKHIPKSHSGLSVNSLAVTEDGQFLVSAGDDNSIIIYDLKRNCSEYRRVGNVHENGISSVAFLKDTSVIVSAGYDGIIKFTEYENRRNTSPFISLICLDSTNWAVVSRDGHFDGSPGGINQLHWVIDDSPLFIETFFNKNYFPGLLTSLFARASKAVPEIKNEAFPGITKIPSVKINYPYYYDTLGTSKMNFELLIAPGDFPVSQVLVYHNKKLVHNVVYPVPKKDSSTLFVPVMDLSEGKNDIKIIVVDVNLNESNPAETIVFSKETKPEETNLYIVSIGISRYRDPSNDLLFAKNDAESVTKVLSDNNSQLVRNIIKYNILDELATKENITGVLDEIGDKAKPSDILILYYAGHGVTFQDNNGSDFFFALQNFNFYSLKENKTAENLISAEELGKRLSSIRAKKQLVIIDACHSGSGIEKFWFTKGIDKLSRFSGITAIASAWAEGTALELKNLGHGLFTYVLLKGMQGEAADSDNNIRVLWLKSYIDREVPRLSRQLLKNKVQNPFGISSGQDFIIGKIKR